MSFRIRSFVPGALTLMALLAAGCADGTPDEASAGTAGPLPEGATLPADHPPIGAAPQGTAVPEDAPEGVVRETMDSGGYTYVLLEMDGEEIWSAGPVTELAEGDRVALVGVMGMEHFQAASLGRTFDRILFVSRFAER